MFSKVFIEVFQAIVLAVLPSAGAQEDPHVYRWRQTIGLTLIFLIVVQAGNIGLMRGWFPNLSTGFASADELETVKDAQKEAEILTLSEQIIVTTEKACDAAAIKNQDAKRFHYEHLAELLVIYRSLRGYGYDPPRCSQL